MVINKSFFFTLIPVLLLLFSSCNNNESIHDLGDDSYTLLDQDSTTIDFPSDFSGQYLVIGFIYTHCPDICPVTTANMKNAFNMLDDTSDVHFIGISFDPERDTPSVLANYMQNFKLDKQHFTMLTGDSAAIGSLLENMDVKAAVSYTQTDSSGTENYWINHTDRISIMDKQGRVRFEYPGSKVPPEHIVEDLNKIRGGWF